MKNEDIHVLVIPSWYPTTFILINGIFFKEQAKSLAGAGIKVGVIYPETRGLTSFKVKDLKQNYFQTSILDEDSIPTLRKHSWNLFPRMNKMQSKQWIYEAKRLFSKYIKKYGVPNIIHAHSVLWGGYTAMLLAKEYNIPFVLTEHSSSYAQGLIKDWEIPYIKATFEGADKLLAVSRPYVEILKKFTNGREIEVLPNFIDTNFFSYREKNKDKKFVFLVVAFLKPEKGIDILIKSFAEAFKGNQNIVLKIGGEGIHRKYLESLVDELNIRDQVMFLGELSREEVRGNLWQSNVFVLPSYFETFGVVLIEALSTGTPVISTNSGGQVDIVSPFVGKLVDPGDVHQLSEALIRVYEEYNKFDQVHVRNYAEENFSNSAISNKLIDIYKTMLNRD